MQSLKNKGLGTEGRPSQIQTWIKYARKGTPEIADVEGFIEQTKAWWGALNPEWRVKDGTLLKEEKGSLDAMRKPGANGFLSILAALRWWWQAKGAMADWRATLEDVTWVLATLVKRCVSSTQEECPSNSLQYRVRERRGSRPC
jgi:hypothetical protein